MANAEKVVIDIVANNQASSVLEKVRSELLDIQKISQKYASSVSSLKTQNQPSKFKDSKTSKKNQNDDSDSKNIPKLNTTLTNIQRRISTVLTNIQKRVSTVLGNIQRRISTVLGNVQRRISSIGGNIQRRISAIGGNIQRRISVIGTNVQRRVSTVGSNIQRRVSSTLTNIQRRISTVGTNVQRNANISKIQQRVSSALTNIYRRVSNVGSNVQRRVSTVGTNIQRRVSNTLSNIQRRVSTVLGNIYRRFNSNQSRNGNQSVINVLNSINQNVSRIASRVRNSSSSNQRTGNTRSQSSTSTKTIDNINQGVDIARSNFHDLNTIMESAGNKFQQMSMQIAGIFGAAGIGDMIGKMWEGAAQRQTNMLYLMHQKGTEQANAYYNEIMEIVTRLPGDDTFLTNILNMASALDTSVAIDDLKELGTAITDYYIASTMKGELPFETQKDIRKYITTGDTRSMRNSLLAGELEMLEDKNNVLERTQALQKALDKTGFTGMSEYESATNELEEFKGHFQKAFADLGTIITSVVQPLMKFYNTIDTLFGSRVSQLIIVVGMLLIGFFTIVATGMLMFSGLSRTLEITGMLLQTYTGIMATSTGVGSLFVGMLKNAIGYQALENIAVDGSVRAGLRQLAVKTKVLIATSMNVDANVAETLSLWGLIGATGTAIRTKLLKIAVMINGIIFGVKEAELTAAQIILEGRATSANLTATQVKEAERIITIANVHAKLMDISANIKSIIYLIPKTIATWRSGDASLYDAFAQEVDAISTNSNTISTIRNTFAKLKNAIQDAIGIGVKLVNVAIKWLTTEATFAEALASEFNTIAKLLETDATLGLAIATAILEAELLPIVIIVGAIALAIIGLVIGFQKLLSVLKPVTDGIGRLWNAFMNSDIVKGIIQYFGDFIATIQDVIKSISDMLGALFGLGQGGGFDIVQTIIDLFGKLGDIIMWVWNIFDDWSNSPLGIITWLNPLGILIFHLDELGSFFEDVRDAIDRFVDTPEFQELIEAWNEAITALQEPFQEIWSLINEIISMFGEIFGQDPEGQGTEDRINFLVEILKGLAFLIKVTIIPAIKVMAFNLRIILTPLRVILTVIKAIVGVFGNLKGSIDGVGQAISNALNPLNMINSVVEGIKWVVGEVIGALTSFFERDDVKKYTIPIMNYFQKVYDLLMKWLEPLKPVLDWFVHFIEVITNATSWTDILREGWNTLIQPIQFVKNLIESIGSIVTKVEDTIKNSFIGKALGWDKDGNEDDKKNIFSTSIDKLKEYVQNANISPLMKNQMLGEMDKQNLTSGNVNDVKNLGQTYNQNNNQRQVVVNNNFSEGSMPIDARNMTKKEARSMFIGAFGYRRAVGYNGILR